ncbi:MAG: 1-(5-phosphoribosyl)-5-[(5-phosphoribosylamino)methylideneamino]imidazole-4-carboxamide isomerase [Bacteroidia bacterium]|nr:1-(5-phosphoribosyl)-5-[(5-phosphoribosylamino)methylideneamino]imidazole-4-carboxamide isomerase [Bacteroidia bacterium]
MRIIPAIDIIDGKCVRLTKGDYNTKKVYSKNPLEIARSFEDYGIQYLHLVDLDGAKLKHIVNYKLLDKICSHTNLQVDFGGGLKTDEDVRIAFESGASQITGGSIAVEEAETFSRWIQSYGNEKIILGADCKNRKIATSAWMEHTDIDVVEFITKYVQKGVKYVVCTDINKDGLLQGPSFELYNELISKVNPNLIASGGVSDINDILELKKLGCEGVIIGKALYEGKITLTQLQELC